MIAFPAWWPILGPAILGLLNLRRRCGSKRMREDAAFWGATISFVLPDPSLLLYALIANSLKAGDS